MTESTSNSRACPDRFLPAVPAMVAALVLSAAGAASAAVDPEVVIATADRLGDFSLDGDHTFPADGQLLDRDGMRATFAEGTFRPIQRPDGRIVGLVFDGKGTVEVSLPAGIETAAWQAATSYSSLAQDFSAAFLRFTDATLDDLQGDRALSDDPDSTGSAFRLYENRNGLLEHPDWTRWHPRLLLDQLDDLYAGGHVGGHLLAEFRLADASGTNWLSYFHNPRGGLAPGETTQWYTLKARGAAPPMLNVLASWGTGPETAPPIDIGFIDLDVTFPTRAKASRSVVNADIVADIGVVNLLPRPLTAVTLELERERHLCQANPDDTRIKVRKVTDPEGRSLAAVHRGNRLFIPLVEPVAPGAQVVLHVEYGGPMTQGLPYSTPDTQYSELGPWAWYPRNPRLDRYATKVALHLPRFMRAVAPGDLTETREEKDGWHFTYEEPGGVRTITVALGDFVMSKESDQGSNPRVIAWVPRPDQEMLAGAAKSTRALVDFVSSVWGPYPYSTLHVVENVAHPATNWRLDLENAAGNWSCIPPSQVHPWQGFVEGASGLLTAVYPTTAPSQDSIEARYLSRYLEDALQVSNYLRVIDLTRQWFGHMVPPKTYRDVWIGEAIAQWTGLLYMQSAVGKGALKERSGLLRDLMTEGVRVGVPLGVGERLGRNFVFQVWGRGPLIVNAMVDGLGAQPFLTAMNTLINRASATGIDTHLLIESISTLGRAEFGERIGQLVEQGSLPRVEYSTSVDKSTGEVRLLFLQLGEPARVDIAVELGLGGKDTEKRVAHLTGEWTEVVWNLDTAPKKVTVDPMGLALVESLKKVKDLQRVESDDGGQRQ